MDQRTNSVTYRFSAHVSNICIVYCSPPAAVVEQVVNGSTFRAFLLPSDVSPTYQYVTLLLSGVRAPSARLGEDKEPFEDEAKFFVESRLLQRDVQIILGLIDRFD